MIQSLRRTAIIRAKAAFRFKAKTTATAKAQQSSLGQEVRGGAGGILDYAGQSIGGFWATLQKASPLQRKSESTAAEITETAENIRIIL